MRTPSTLCVFLLLGLGGCVAPASNPEASPGVSPASARTHAWGLEDCTVAFVVIPVQRDALKARLPAGFEPVPFPGAVGASPASFISFDAYDCKSGIGWNETVAPITYGSVYTSVRPPSEYVQKDVQAYFMKWDILVPDADRRAVFASWGLPARDGRAMVHTEPSAQVDLELGGFGHFSFEGQLPDGGSPSQLYYVEFTPTPSGIAVWHANATLDDPRSGAGTATLSPGNWVSDLVGATTAAAEVETVRFTLRDSNVRVP